MGVGWKDVHLDVVDEFLALLDGAVALGEVLARRDVGAHAGVREDEVAEDGEDLALERVRPGDVDEGLDDDLAGDGVLGGDGAGRLVAAVDRHLDDFALATYGRGVVIDRYQPYQGEPITIPTDRYRYQS